MRLLVLFIALGLVPAQAAVTLSITPFSPTVRAGEHLQFIATVSGATNTTVTWMVTAGPLPSATKTTQAMSMPVAGNEPTGQITATGMYTAPAAVPKNNTVVVTAISAADSTVVQSTTVTLLNPTPVLQTVTPTQVNINLPFTLTLTGTGFIGGSVAMLAGAPLTTTVISATQLKASGTTSAAVGSTLAVTVVNPNPGSTTSNSRNVTVLAAIKVTVSPATVTLRIGDTRQFTASLQNAVDRTVTWLVNGVAGGSAVTGTIDASGLYKTPLAVPATNTVTVSARSNADPTATGSGVVTLNNAVPAVSAVSPSSANYGDISLTIAGTGFAPGATVKLGATALIVGAVTPTQITATGVAAPVAGNLAPLTVTNPNPGSATSNAAIVALSVANPKISYNAAYRFLEQATFGPDPASIAHLQQVGFDQWFAEQQAAPKSDYTDPPDTTTGYGPTQDQFFVNSFSGQDQLRQRVAFTLSQIWVISGVKTSKDVAVIPYLRILRDDAFGSYLTLMHDITLNPAMGNFLDMVNNDKFNARTGVAPNENYARELMQLFTIGLVMLNNDGSATTNPPTATYDQDTVATNARVFTGWTYPPIPGVITAHHNPENYFAPMVSIESNHDTDPKTIFGQTLPGGQTAEMDLNGALQIIFNHPNVGPFVALRMIQHMVKSNPSPTYISNVAAAFNQSPRGSLWNVVKAVLMDPEARAGDNAASGATDGHLREPVLLETQFLHAMGAQVATGNPLTSQGNNMGQNLFNAASVFNYYSPFFRTSGGTVAGPEFQLMTPSTAILRPNFIWSAVTSGLGSKVTLDMTPFTALASQPDKLLDALNAALMHGQMSANMRTSILTVLNSVTDPKLRAQYAVFLVGSSSQYQVEQ